MKEGAGELDLEEVRKTRPGPGGEPREILRGIDLTVPAGEVSVIFGPSGGGKSTLVRLLNRLEDPSEGRIRFRGRPLSEIPPLQLRRQVALMLQKPFMFPGTVADNLRYPFRLRGEPLPAVDSAAVGQVLELCRIETGLLAQDARTLSLGQQQRVSLARTLLPGPAVLVLDEPTSALDRPTGDLLGETLRRICREDQRTVVLVTHDLRLVERTADRAAYLEAGRIVESGPAASLLEHPAGDALRRFLGKATEIENG